MMTAARDLIAIGIAEKDTNKDLMLSWCYPAFTESQKEIILRKCDTENETNIFFHHNHYWLYIYCCEVPSDSKVTHMAMILQTRNFNPYRNFKIVKLLSQTYILSNDPSMVLQQFFSLLVSGSCNTQDNGIFHLGDFINWKSSLPIKDVISTFGLETIIIYTALLLKKRILVYHHKAEPLVKFLSAIPALVWHRNNWDILYPFLDVNELEQLNLTSHYVAGTLSVGTESLTHLYDIFINLAATEISIASHAKDMFIMTKTHKDIAVCMVHQTKDPNISNSEAIKEISLKTQELLNAVKYSNENDGESQKNVALTLGAFYRNISIAEGISN